MNSFNLVKAGGDPKHFSDALAMSEREDRKASQNRKMIKMPSSSQNYVDLQKNWADALLKHLPQLIVI